MPVQIIPYQKTLDSSIAALESKIVQGKGIRLRILKDCFLQRSAAFTQSFPLLALNEENKVIGTAIGAQTTIAINEQLYDAGFVFDAKVHKDHRNKGIGGQLAKTQKDWFHKQGWKRNFTTLKSSNIPVIKLSAKTVDSTWLTKFVYLTIPTNVRVKKKFTSLGNSAFNVRLFDHGTLSPLYYTQFETGLAVFHTWQLYRLKIDSISWIYKVGLYVLRAFLPKRYQNLPGEQQIMEFATLFNHTEENINGLDEVLEHLSKDGKQFLLICCSERDKLYRYLKPYSINTYGYYLLSDFPISKEDIIAIDVRCL